MTGGDIDVRAALVRSLHVLVRGQLPTGEIAAYFRHGASALGYTRSPVPSAYVHDALACFDPASSRVQTAILELISASGRVGFVRAVRAVRQRIRRFLAWQEECDGRWRFFGRGSGVAPDADTTALAACALLDVQRRTAYQPWRAHAEVVSSMLDTTAGLDLAAAGNGVRFLASVGYPVEGHVAALLRRLEDGGFTQLDRDCLLPAYCLARAWTEGGLPDRSRLDALILPGVLATQRDDGSFGGPVSTAFGLSVLLESKPESDERRGAEQALRSSIGEHGGWAFEPLLPSGAGSLACSTALAMSTLARAAVDAREGPGTQGGT